MSMPWPQVPLGEITTAQYGLSVAATDDGTVPILGMKNLQDGRIVANGSVRVRLTPKEIEGYQLHVGDILFNRTNSYDLVGKAALVETAMSEPTVFASYLVRFRVDESRASPSFVNYILTSPRSERRLKNMATPGVSQFNINPTSLRKHFLIPLPPIDEQCAISSVLDVWSGSICRLNDLVFAKLRFKQGLMQQFLNSKGRDTWREYHLGDLFDERSETNRTDLPLLSITSERGVIPRDEIDRKDSSSEDKSLYKRIAPGDIGYNTMRMWQGVSAVSQLEGIVSPAYTICVPRREIDADFAGYLFKYPPMVHLFYRYSQGLVSDTLNLKFHEFSAIKMRIPDVAEQCRIVSALKSVDAEICLLSAQIESLKEQKKGLMQKLLTGEKRVEGIRTTL